MSKEFEALSRTKSEIIDGFPTGNLWVGMTPEELDAIKQALTELQAIKEAEPSEALECLEYLGDFTLDVDILLCNTKAFPKIKQALLKAEAQEKLFKHIKRNDMEHVIPLSSIIGGLSQDDKHKFIEHIYYTWAELNEKHEKLNDEHKQQTQELEKYKKALEIIFKKNVNTLLLELASNVEEYNERIVPNGKLTQAEFDLLKEMRKIWD